LNVWDRDGEFVVGSGTGVVSDDAAFGTRNLFGDHSVNGETVASARGVNLDLDCLKKSLNDFLEGWRSVHKV
jgi:hypothetical protein